jgi:hypothetical protein
MKAPDIVMNLRCRGLQIRTEDGYVMVDPDVLTDAEVATIVANKPAIIAYLLAEADHGEPRNAAASPVAKNSDAASVDAAAAPLAPASTPSPPPSAGTADAPTVANQKPPGSDQPPRADELAVSTGERPDAYEQAKAIAQSCAQNNLDLATYLEQHPDDVAATDPPPSQDSSLEHPATCEPDSLYEVVEPSVQDAPSRSDDTGTGAPAPVSPEIGASEVVEPSTRDEPASSTLEIDASEPQPEALAADPTSEFPPASELPPPNLPPPQSPPPLTGRSRVTEVARQLTRRYSRIAFWRRNATGELRTQIEQIVAEFSPVIDEHLIRGGNFDGLHDILLDEQRQLDDCLRAHRNLADGSPLE